MSERGMRPRALAREAWRDMTSGTAWIGVWSLVVALLLGGGIALDLRVIALEASAAQDYQRAMASVHVVESPGAIDASACRALARLEGVSGAFAIRKAERSLTPAAMPSSSLQTWEYSGEARGVLDLGSVGADSAGVVLAEQVGEALGLRAGDELALAEGDSARVQGVYRWDENDGRRSGYAYSALVPVPAQGAFDACWVRLWPLNLAVDSLMRIAVIPTGQNQKVDAYSLNASLGSSFDGQGRYFGRISAPMMWILAAGAILAGALAVRRRRLELASDLHAGVRRADLLVKLLVHGAVTAFAAAVLVMPALVWAILRAPAQDRPDLWAHVGLLGAVVLAGFLLGTIIAGLAVREKKLFEYFKAR